MVPARLGAEPVPRAAGLLKTIGATVLANACGPCIGQWRRAQDMVGVPNTIVTSYNRNFPMRNDGQATTMNFIGSPEIVTALALAGTLSFNPVTDTMTGADGRPFRLEPPRAAPEVPARNFDRGHSSYVAPPEDGSRIELAVAPDSERIQLMEPWPAWDGQDFLDMTVNFDFGKSFPHTAILPNYESAAFDAHELPAIQGFLFVDPK